MMQMHPVKSTTVHSIGYDHDTSTLYVKFQSAGPTYAYEGITPDQHSHLLSTPSKGKYIHSTIKPNAKSVRKL